MLGLMQDQPLLISSLIEFASRHHHDGQIVSRRVEGDIHRYTYRDAWPSATASPRWPGTGIATSSCISASRAAAA